MPRFLFILFFSLIYCLSSGQGNLVKDADSFYNSEDYHKALDYYIAYNRSKPGTEHVLTRIGICYYQTNDTDAAKKSLNAVIGLSKKPNPTALLYLAKSHHASSEFEEASDFYKLFLKHSKLDDPKREHVRDAIKRCGSGIRISDIRANAIVENLGNRINTVGDDYSVAVSPNYDDRIYFSSVRAGNKGSKTSDIYLASLVNGSWSDLQALEALNTVNDDHILDFNSNGQALIYWKGMNDFSGDIMVDTFSVDSIPRRGFYQSPIQSMNGDGGAFLFNDTILLFYSYRSGGYGGADLYFSLMQNGSWSKAHNLGPEINSSYDEISPFLSNDASTLYFASNNINSMGGFDLFRSRFETGLKKWGAPENLGAPINSPKNDTQLRINRKGLKGYLTSDRTDGIGKRDIFVIYFKDYLPEQQSDNVIVSLIPENELIGSEQSTSAIDNQIKFDDNQIKNYSLKPIYYDESDNVLLPENMESLRQTIEILKQNPSILVEAIGSSEKGAAMEFDLYFSIKRAEEIAKYLMDNGIAADRIIARGCGQNYPVVRNSVNNQPVLLAKKLNRRVDLLFRNLEGLPIRIEMNAPKVNNSTLQLSGIKILENQSRGVSYRVKFALTENMYNGNIISEYPDPMIDKPMNTDRYRYTVGLYNTYQSGQFMKNDLLKQGVSEVEVLAFVDGNEVDKESALEWVDEYPDLIHFLVNE